MVTVRRKQPRSDGKLEKPLKTAQGYKLADPKNGKDRHHTQYAIYEPTLERAADRIRVDRLSLWFKGKGIRETLISADQIEII